LFFVFNPFSIFGEKRFLTGELVLKNIPSHIFREYDIRGVADKELSSEVCFLIGHAFGTMVVRAGEKKVCVGCDNRLSSPRIKKEFIKGLVASGCNVFDTGVVPTPVLYYAIFKLECYAGVSVTGSHNPAEFNGFKLSRGFESFHGKSIQELRHIIEKGEFENGNGFLKNTNVLEDYVKELKKRFCFKNKVRVAVDCGNGTAALVAPRLLKELGANVVELYCESDGRFPNHLPDPTVPEFMADLGNLVVKKKCDFGIGFDGDMDRIGVVDSSGKLIFGDRLLGIYVQDLLSRVKNAKIVFDVKCSAGIKEVISGAGGIGLENATGHSLIKDRMKREGALLAGEMSGHMFFKENWFGFDDALFAACLLIDIVIRSKKSIEWHFLQIPRYPATPEIRVDCADEKKFLVVTQVRNSFEKKNKVSVIDGVKVFFEGGWGLVRASNTQPKIIIRCEAKNEEELEKIQKTVFEVLKRCLETA
jgi:phosphomannomutase / phosphoglucomutase